jgi:hypothetical protein
MKSKKSEGSFRKDKGSSVLPKTPIKAPMINTMILIAIIFSNALKLLNLFLKS